MGLCGGEAMPVNESARIFAEAATPGVSRIPAASLRCYNSNGSPPMPWKIASRSSRRRACAMGARRRECRADTEQHVAPCPFDLHVFTDAEGCGRERSGARMAFREASHAVGTAEARRCTPGRQWCFRWRKRMGARGQRCFARMRHSRYLEAPRWWAEYRCFYGVARSWDGGGTSLHSEKAVVLPAEEARGSTEGSATSDGRNAASTWKHLFGGRTQPCPGRRASLGRRTQFVAHREGGGASAGRSTSEHRGRRCVGGTQRGLHLETPLRWADAAVPTASRVAGTAGARRPVLRADEAWLPSRTTRRSAARRPT